LTEDPTNTSSNTSLTQYNIWLSVGIMQNIDEAFRMHSDGSLQ